MNMVTLSWIAQTGYLLQEPSKSSPTQTSQKLPCHIKFMTPPWRQGQVELIQITISLLHTSPLESLWFIHRPLKVTTSGQLQIIIEVRAIKLTATHHIDLIADHPHIEVLQLTTPEFAVDHTLDHPTSLQGECHTDWVHSLMDHVANHTSRRTQEWKSKVHTQTITALMNIPVTQERNLIT